MKVRYVKYVSSLIFLLLTSCYMSARISGSLESNTLVPNPSPSEETPQTPSLPPVATFSLVKKVLAQSARNTCIIYNSSSISKCTGSNYNATDTTYGLLGMGYTNGTSVNTLTALADDSLYISVSMGEYSGCGIKPDQSIKCWGRFVGDGSSGDRYSPTAISETGKFIDVAVGSFHSCAITETGDMKCWGDGWDGKLGTGNNAFSAVPVAVASASKFKKVSAGRNHTCAITSESKLECWGNNSVGQLGDGTFTSPRLTAVTPINTGETYIDVSCGEDTTCAITSSNVLKCWGRNSSGQVGVGNTSNVNTPTIIDLSQAYSKVSVAASGYHVCAVTTLGVGKCWGANGSGQLGIGNTTSQTLPAVVSGSLTFKDIIAGGYSTCGSTTADKLYCWGSNGFSQLGQGAVGSQNVPALTENNFN